MKYLSFVCLLFLSSVQAATLVLVNQTDGNDPAHLDLHCKQETIQDKKVQNRLWMTDCDSVKLIQGQAGVIVNPEKRSAKIVALKIGEPLSIKEDAPAGLFGKKLDGLMGFLARDQIETKYYGGKSLADAPVFPLMPYNAVTLSVPSIRILTKQQVHYPKKKGADAVEYFSIDSVTIEELAAKDPKRYLRQGSLINIPVADLKSNTDYKWTMATPSGQVSGRFYTEMSEDEAYIKEELTELDALLDKSEQPKLYQELLAIRLKQNGYDFQGDTLQQRLRRDPDESN